MYKKLSDAELNQLFSHSTWTLMTGTQRLDVLNELAHRVAVELGIKTCTVSLKEMYERKFGSYNEVTNTISLNKRLVETNEFVFRNNVTEKGTVYVMDSNAQLYNTVCHEIYHAYQEKVINRIVKHEPPNDLTVWEANNRYYIISSFKNDTLYHFQSMERTARAYAEKKTADAFAGLTDDVTPSPKTKQIPFEK